MIVLSSLPQRMQRHREFARGRRDAQICRSLIKAKSPDKEDKIFEYWDRAKMTSSGAKLE